MQYKTLQILAIYLVTTTFCFAKSFSFVDPINDDNAWGDVIYPIDNIFKPGELDLKRVDIQDDSKNNGYLIKVSFYNKIRTPKEAVSDVADGLYKTFKHEFFAFNVDLYFSFAGMNEGLTGAAPGRKVAFTDDSRWNKSVILSPRPEVAESLLYDQLAKISYSQKQYIESYSRDKREAFDKSLQNFISEHYYFPKKIKVKYNTISFFVPRSFFGAEISDATKMAVLVTGADPSPAVSHDILKEVEPNLMVVPVKVGRTVGAFGGLKEFGNAQPNVIDMLLPSKELQYQELGNFNQPANTFTKISMFEMSKYAQISFKAADSKPELSIKPLDLYDVSAPIQSPKELTNIPSVQSTIDLPSVNVAPVIAQSIDSENKGNNNQANTPTNSSSGVSAKTPLQRLRELDELKNEGLIDENEYQKIRTQILNSL